MRLLFVSKQRPQQRDLVSRPYGRFYHLPRILSALGHDVHVLLIGHAGDPSTTFVRDDVTWNCIDIRSQRLGSWSSALAIARRTSPDWVVGCSDAWVGVAAKGIARHVGARLAIDAYDNYEAYMPWNLPLRAAWRHAISVADAVTAAGPQLAARLDSHRRGRRPAVIVPMAADPSFVPCDQRESRVALGLPSDARLVGYMGGWARNRGTGGLIKAFRQLRQRRPETCLVLTGRPPPSVLIEPGVVPLGYINDSQLPIAMAALSVACVITADSSFGRFSYPAKLCEAMACHVPVAATATGPVRWMLRDDERFLVKVGDAGALAARIEALLDGPERIPYRDLPSWADSAWEFSTALESA